jgi:hypothetical protein
MSGRHRRTKTSTDNPGIMDITQFCHCEDSRVDEFVQPDEDKSLVIDNITQSDMDSLSITDIIHPQIDDIANQFIILNLTEFEIKLLNEDSNNITLIGTIGPNAKPMDHIDDHIAGILVDDRGGAVLTTQDVYINDQEVRCWHCTRVIPHNNPIGIPIRYVQKTDTFFVSGFFCCTSCVLARLLDNPTYRTWEKIAYLYHMQKRMTGSTTRIYPSPPKEIQQEYGGSVSHETYSKYISDDLITHTGGPIIVNIVQSVDSAFTLKSLSKSIGPEILESDIAQIKKQDERESLVKVVPFNVYNEKYKDIIEKLDKRGEVIDDWDITTLQQHEQVQSM